jgi:hypothetical protein
MIISDLNYLEDVDEASEIIGGVADKDSINLKIKLPDVDDILKKVNKEVKKTRDEKTKIRKKGGGKITTFKAVSKKGNAKAVAITEIKEW